MSKKIMTERNHTHLDEGLMNRISTVYDSLASSFSSRKPSEPIENCDACIQKEDNLRSNIKAAMKQAESAINYLRDGDEHSCGTSLLDSRYWETCYSTYTYNNVDYCSPKGWKVVKGKKTSEAIKSIFAATTPNFMECKSTLVVVYYKAILDTFGDEVFNKAFPNLFISWNDKLHLETLTLEKNPLLLEEGALLLEEGDWVYFEGHPGYDAVMGNSGLGRGENTIYMGNDKYSGLGCEEKTEEELKKRLLSWYENDTEK